MGIQGILNATKKEASRIWEDGDSMMDVEAQENIDSDDVGNANQYEPPSKRSYILENPADTGTTNPLDHMRQVLLKQLETDPLMHRLPWYVCRACMVTLEDETATVRHIQTEKHQMNLVASCS